MAKYEGYVKKTQHGNTLTIIMYDFKDKVDGASRMEKHILHMLQEKFNFSKWDEKGKGT